MDNRRRFRANSNNLSAAGGGSLARIIFSKVGIALVPIRRNASSAFFHPGELKGGSAGEPICGFLSRTVTGTSISSRCWTQSQGGPRAPRAGHPTSPLLFLIGWEPRSLTARHRQSRVVVQFAFSAGRAPSVDVRGPIIYARTYSRAGSSVASPHQTLPLPNRGLSSARH